MRALLTFVKKEMLEQLRSGKLIFLAILFVLFGIMNPAVAKLTPWLLELMADTLAESGINLTTVTVSAMDSWVQFFKNIPMGLIAFVLLESSIFTKEYASGTLVLSLTKGLARVQVIVSKTIVLMLLWTACYWLCFGITYGYNAYFWDNSVAQSLAFSVVCWYLFGIWVLALTLLFSTLANSNTGVLVGTGGVAFASYLVGWIPKVNTYLPTGLTDGTSLIYGAREAKDYVMSIVVAAVIGVFCFGVSIPIFNKKQL